MEYQMVMAISPLEVTKVNSQLKQQPIISASVITAEPWISEESRSDIPSCRTFAVTVMMAVV